MAEYKFYYFDLRARGEPARLLLEYGGIKYEDFRIPMNEWSNYKSKMPMGQVPVLECLKTHQMLSQSLAISKFVAEKVGLAGKDAWEQAKVLEYACGVLDQWGTLTKVYMQKLQNNPALEKENWAAYKANDGKQFLDYYTRFLEQNGTGWLVGNSVTWADIATAELLTCLEDCFDKDALAGHPKLKEYAHKVMGLPQLKGYVSGRRPKTMC